MFKLSPLFFIYIILILSTSNSEFSGDERRYVMFATNLSKGYYSPKNDPNIWNGPGYPIILIPFVLFKLPFLNAKLINALFLFMAVFYFNQTLRSYIDDRSVLGLSYILGFILRLCAKFI